MKKCTKCEKEKELTEFSKHRCFSSRYAARCKACLKEDKLKWEAANPEHVQKVRKKYNKKRAKWAKKNPEEHRAICKAWKLANPEKNREYTRKSRAKAKLLKQAAVP